MMKNLFTLIMLIVSINTDAQYGIATITGSYSYQFPLADLSSNYGNSSMTAVNVNFKNIHNWIFAVEGQYYFSANVNDAYALGSLVNNSGVIIGNNTSVVTPKTEGRGGNMFLEVGKIFPTSSENKNSGFAVKLGLGYFFYKSVITTDEVTPQLLDPYYAGYTKLQSGLSINPFVGYVFYGKKKMFNTQLGIQSMISPSSYVNKWDFVNNTSLENISNMNIFIGPKFGMSIMIKSFENYSVKEDEYFYN